MTLLNQVEPDGEERSVGMLAAVGIEPEQECVYVALVDCPGMTASAVSRTVGLPRDASEEALDQLVAKGLVTTDPGPLLRYRATAPDVAIEALIVQQQGELARARLAASDLRQRARHASSHLDDGAGQVEAVAGGLAATQRLWQLQVTASRDVLAVGLPSFIPSPAADQDPMELACLRRGVTHRALYAREVLASAGRLDGIRRYVAAGGQVRVSEAPVRLVAVDGKAAALPIYVDGELTEVTIVRSDAVVAALTALAEFAWLQAAPLSFTADGSAEAADNGIGSGLASLVPLLMAGCKDETIARQLGVSTRTLDRRIRVMMDGLGAVTRFQAGWLAACKHPRASGGGTATCPTSASQEPCG